MSYIIALDVGTSSMRSVLFDGAGSIANISSAEYHTVFPKPSYVEQDPLTWLHALNSILEKTGEYLKKNEIKVEAISVTSQRASLIPVRIDGEPLMPAIMWQDKRTISICDRLIKEYGLSNLHRRTGLRVNPFFVLNKIIWLREEAPEIFHKSAKFLGVQDYVIHQLTGRFVTDWSQASRTMLMDIKNFCWDPDLLSIAGIRLEQLCELVPPGTIVGTLKSDLAARCDLPADLPIVISGGDQQNAAMALGVTHPGTAEANTGTGSFVLAYAEQPIVTDKADILCQASAVKGKWISEAPIFNTGAIYRWFKEQFFPELEGARLPFEIMNQYAKDTPIGSNGVLLLPHFEGSAAPYWNPKAKGTFFNLGLGTTRLDMTRAILESIAMEIAENVNLMRQAGGEINCISVAGGMVRSDLFCQMQADTTQAEIIRYNETEATALGACINAWVALGMVETHDDALNRLADEARQFYPVPEHVALYQDMMERKQILYRALNDTGVYDRFMYL